MPSPQQQEETAFDSLINYVKYQGNWLEKARGNLMVVATVIATMSFQVAVNPPGGVFQSDTPSDQGCPVNKTCKAGTSIFSHTNHTLYISTMITSTVSFTSSLAMILFLTFGLTKHKFFMWVLMLLMFISVICMAGTYMLSFILLGGSNDATVQQIAAIYAIFWVALFVFLLVFYLIKLIFWVSKTLVMCVVHTLCFPFKLFAGPGTRSQRPVAPV